MSNILKTTSIIILFLLAKNIYSQNSKLNFEAEFSPEICFRMEYDESRGFNTYKKFRKPIALFDAGFNIKYSINEKSKIGTGIFYSSIGNMTPLNIADASDTDYTAS